MYVCMCCVKVLLCTCQGDFEIDEEASQEGSTVYNCHLMAVHLMTPFAR